PLQTVPRRSTGGGHTALFRLSTTRGNQTAVRTETGTSCVRQWRWFGNEMNLKTNYLGIPLRHPLIIGSSSLTNDLDVVRQLEDEGAAALVLRSLYEEEIVGEQMDAFFQSDGYGDTSAEATSYFPDPTLAPGPDEYLEHVHRVKAAVGIPVIAS